MNEYVSRLYRQRHQGEDLAYFGVKVKESDLHIGAAKPLKAQAMAALSLTRNTIEAEIQRLPSFRTSLVPLPIPPSSAQVVSWMYQAAAQSGVGPMAAVAGAVARAVGESLCGFSPEVIVENGGDLFVSSKKERKISIFAGASPLSEKLAIQLPPGVWGVCTSSAKVGPSLSFGQTDASVIVAHDAALADAAASTLGNAIHTTADLSAAIQRVMGIPGIVGAVAILGEHVAACGNISLIPAD